MWSPGGLIPVPVAGGTPCPPLSPDAEGSGLELRRLDVDAHRLELATPVSSLYATHHWR